MAGEVNMENTAVHCAHLIFVRFIGFLSAKPGSSVVVFKQGAPKGLSSARAISALPFKSCLIVRLASVFSESPVCAYDSICAHIFAEISIFLDEGSLFSLVSFLALLQLAPFWWVLWKSLCFQGQHSVQESLQ